MASRLNLSEELKNILGSNQVYFQSPGNIRMSYPCIIYDLATVNETYADNLHYWYKQQYSITVVTRDKDSDLAERIARHFPMSRFNRHYVADNLYHDVINIYY